MTETEVRTFLDRYFTAAMQGTDFDAFAALYAEDGVLEDPVGTPPLRGRAAIREFLAAGRQLIAHGDITVHEVMACGLEVAARWSGSLRLVTGDSVALTGIGVFTFADAEHVRHVREFYDVALIARIFSGTAA